MIRLRRLFLGSGFRLTLIYTVVFMASVIGIGALTRNSVNGALETHAHRRIEIEADALVDEFNHGGRADLDAALIGRFRNPSVYYRYTLVEAASSDAHGLPRAQDAPQGDATGSPARIRATRTLADGTRFIVTDDLANEHVVETILVRALLMALGTAAILGIGTGLLLSGILLRRVDAVTRLAEAVVAGDLARRIATDGSGDEFDRLAATLNRMLDRIGGLLDNLRQVSSDVAHDLRTPLSRLRQGLEAVERQSGPIETYQGAVTRAIAETDVILDIFSALLRIAQIEGGARRAGFRPVDVSRVLRKVLEAYAIAIEESGRALTVHVPDDIMLHGDLELLTQMIVNLVENEIQHTPVGTKLDFRLSSSSQGVDLVIDDDGPGIPAADREKVLRRFYRVEKSRPGGGHGLGLSLVAAVVDLHGGSITFSDNDVGFRTRLSFYNNQ